MKILKSIIAGSLIGGALFVLTLAFPNITFANTDSFSAICIIEIRSDSNIEHYEYTSERITAEMIDQQCWQAAISHKQPDSVISLVQWVKL